MKGFIIDAPEAVLIGKDNTYHCVTAKSGSVEVNGSSLNIKAGWSLFDLANIPTGSEINVSLTDARFDSDALTMSLGAEQISGAVDEYKFGESYTVGAGNTITINSVVKAGSVKIEGLEEVAGESDLQTGKFFVNVAENNTTIKFFTGDQMIGKIVKPIYCVTVANGEKYSVKSTSIPKSCMIVLKFPVYADDEDESEIVAMAQLTIFKAKVEQKWNMGGSYKSASEFALSAKGLDSKRSDKKIFDIDFIPYSA